MTGVAKLEIDTAQGKLKLIKLRSGGLAIEIWSEPSVRDVLRTVPTAECLLYDAAIDQLREFLNQP